MKILFACFALLLFAATSRADGGIVADYDIDGSITISNGTNTESITFDAQVEMSTPFEGSTFEQATMLGIPTETSTGPLGDFSRIYMNATEPTYLAFINGAGDEIDLDFAASFSTDLTGANGPNSAFVWGCQSQACSDDFSTYSGPHGGIYYPGTFDVTVTPLPVSEPSEVGLLVVGLAVVLGLARFRSMLALS